MSSGGARPNAGRKKRDTTSLQIRVATDVAEAVRAYAKENKTTLAEALVAVLAK